MPTIDTFTVRPGLTDEFGRDFHPDDVNDHGLEAYDVVREHEVGGGITCYEAPVPSDVIALVDYRYSGPRRIDFGYRADRAVRDAISDPSVATHGGTALIGYVRRDAISEGGDGTYVAALTVGELDGDASQFELVVARTPSFLTARTTLLELISHYISQMSSPNTPTT